MRYIYLYIDIIVQTKKHRKYNLFASVRKQVLVDMAEFRHAPYNEELNAFEQDMYDLISSIKFRDINDSFQNKLLDEVKRINETNKVIINADKTSNVYQLDQSEYLKLLNDNITKHYQKAPSNV